MQVGRMNTLVATFSTFLMNTMLGLSKKPATEVKGNIGASFPEIPDVPENFHSQEASRIFRVFTSFWNKRKKTSKKMIE